MTCRHSPGDPNCGSHPRNVAARLSEEHQRELAKVRAAIPATPDSEKYDVVDVQRVDQHLVVKVLYPNCSKCSYEGHKVMVFLNVTEADVLRWRKIDPHFRDPTATRSPREAPTPAARFPASKAGWSDAIAYANGKVGMPSPREESK
jgi:hypothetical protein